MPAKKKPSPAKSNPKRPPSRRRTDKARASSPPNGVVEIRGARQNNLKGIDLDLPLGKLNVITGPSGSGKSSLAFQTIYAEGQRRYIETFSPYTRQFFDRMDKPEVDEIRGIPPAIAIEQTNAVKSTRSTVGTITEINDYLKLFFPRASTAFCPDCGKPVRPDTPPSICQAAGEKFAGRSILVTFGVPAPAKTKPDAFFAFLQKQGYLRVFLFGEACRTDEPSPRASLPAVVDVIQDRIKIGPDTMSRLMEAVEAALELGKGQVSLIDAKTGERAAFSSGWHCADCDVTIRQPVPGMFSFNNPQGACPVCRGFGRTIGIDLDRALPDKSLSIAEGVVKAFHGKTYSECQADLARCAKVRGVDVGAPFEDLPPEDAEWVIHGEGMDPDEAWREGLWYGVQGFFDWLEARSYRMHVRVFLSRFRSYTTCRECRGTRLKPEALHYRIATGDGAFLSLPDVWRTPISDLEPLIVGLPLNHNGGDHTLEMLHGEVASRLAYLNHVGLGYLTLDRSTRTLSGGETERVNLTTCLGASLVNTLFVLDEPSIGLHSRDIGRLIDVMAGLRDKGNTLLVVEHDESVIRCADHLIDIGPGRGETGGELLHNGPLTKLSANRRSLTSDYLSGRKTIPVPATRRKAKRGARIRILGARQNNLKNANVDIPLGVFCCVTGVSGSGKSTLVHDVLYQNLARRLGEPTGEEAGRCRDIQGHDKIARVMMVDQSPLSRTPRSTPAVYVGVFDLVRQLFADSPEGRTRGLTPGYFSFNSGGGRCERCWGNGFEKVEMQFLSDLYLRCPECEGKRYQAEVLEIRLEGKSIHDVLEMTVSQAIEFFFARDGRKAGQIVDALRVLDEVGLGYLRMGQPLNTLSGGESQRLKLVGHLLDRSGSRKDRKDPSGKPTLLIFDEPTTGLHFDDVNRLLGVFQRLVESGQSLLVIEHNLEVVKSADWVIDLGPEAGSTGGEVVAAGTPEAVAEHPRSHTGMALRGVLDAGGSSPASGLRAAESSAKYRVKARDIAPLPEKNGQKPTNEIVIHGAREHNLKNIDLAIPRDELVVVTGLSGSGKSTLAFDLIFAEGQRRFLDSMSAYARQFVEQMEKPEVDRISGLPPTVAIEQRVTRGGGKSTVATVTEVYHFLRLLFAKLGVQHCPDCGVAVRKQSVTAIVKSVRTAARKGNAMLLAPLIKARKGFHTDVAKWAVKQGFEILLVDGEFREAKGFQRLERFKEHTIDVVVAEFPDGGTGSPAELRDNVEDALRIGKGTAKLIDSTGNIHILSSEMTCPDCGRAFEELDPRLFSFNSPHGWCRECRGYGQIARRKYAEGRHDSVLEEELEEERRHERAGEHDLVACPDCEGSRINEVARAVRLRGTPIDAHSILSVAEARAVIESLSFTGDEQVIARDILKEISQRLRFMEEVGLGYLSLSRSAKTLSGGESQRIRLAAQLGSNLRGVLYVLDEPTIGLHPRDNQQLLDTLEALRDHGNSLIVVEHDEETMRRSDRVIDLGPGAGVLGGEVMANDTWQKIRKNPASTTGKYLKDPMPHPLRGHRRKLPAARAADGWLRLKGATLHNLRGIDARIPVGRLTVITGVSGSGKSTLMRGVLKPAVDAALKKSAGRHSVPPASSRCLSQKTSKMPAPPSISAPQPQSHPPINSTYKSLEGADQIETVYEVDQTPIGKTSRSTPATYIKVFDEIRKLFAQLPASRMRGYTASRFSYNTEGGRCETCKGNGAIKLEMSFLPTTFVPCEDCRGLRYNPSTLEILYNGKSIGDVMDMTIEQADAFFEAHPKIHRTLSLLNDTGLGYLKLGQPSPTLSGGEAQRIKLVAQLTKGVNRTADARIRKNRKTKSTLYLLEEPSIGLHMADVRKLLDVLHALVDDGHTVAVIEHNLDIIAEADHILDIGPEAGPGGGRLVASGPPEKVMTSKKSHTAAFLKPILG